MILTYEENRLFVQTLISESEFVYEFGEEPLIFDEKYCSTFNQIRNAADRIEMEAYEKFQADCTLNRQYESGKADGLRYALEIMHSVWIGCEPPEDSYQDGLPNLYELTGMDWGYAVYGSLTEPCAAMVDLEPDCGEGLKGFISNSRLPGEALRQAVMELMKKTEKGST